MVGVVFPGGPSCNPGDSVCFGMQHGNWLRLKRPQLKDSKTKKINWKQEKERERVKNSIKMSFAISATFGNLIPDSVRTHQKPPVAKKKYGDFARQFKYFSIKAKATSI